MFIKIFPFSGHLIGVALVLFFTRFQSPCGIKVWFRRVNICRLLFGGLITAFLMVATDYLLLNLPGLPPVDFSRFHILHNNAKLTAVWIAAVWLFIAPSEELISRAFLIDQWHAVFDGKPWASIAAVMLSSIGFGLVHFYEGPGGILSNAAVGLCLGALYVIQRRSLNQAIAQASAVCSPDQPQSLWHVSRRSLQVPPNPGWSRFFRRHILPRGILTG
jgi:membrane protease YdiL (CAAX protease family)